MVDLVNWRRVEFQARAAVREPVARALRMLPSRFAEGIRRSYPFTPTGSLRHHAQRKALGILRYRGIPQELTMVSPVDNPGVRFVRCDSYILECQYWYGEQHGYEAELLTWWKHFCEKARSIVEIGANIGLFTVHGAQAATDASYTAVEAHPGCAAALRQNLVANGLSRVRVVEAAAVAEAEQEKVALLLPGGRDHYVDAPCTGYVGTNEVYGDRRECQSVEVDVVEIEDLVSDADLLKLDVEGQEYYLLSAVQGQLMRARPTIFSELLDNTPRLRELFAELCRSAGYRCFVPSASGLCEIPPADLGTVSVPRSFGVRDVILTCRSDNTGVDGLAARIPPQPSGS